MPARNGAIRQKAEVNQPAPLAIEDAPAQGIDASLPHRPGAGLRRNLGEWATFRPPGTGTGDVLAGGIAVVALVVMLVLELSPWLAIPLAVLTYVAVTLMQPLPGQRNEVDDVTEPMPPVVEVIAERGQAQDPPLPAPSCSGAEAVAAEYGLTRREQELLPLLAQRLTDREIAEHLSISHRTAMNHTANILGKLGLTSRREVAPFVLRYEHLPSVTTHDEPE